MHKRESSRRKALAEARLARRRRRMAAIASAALVGVLAIGGSIAFIMTNTGSIQNAFEPSSVACEVIEDDFTNGVSTEKTEVCVQNTGDVDAYIRAKVLVNWVDGTGKVLGIEPMGDEDYVMILDLNSGWSYCESDGFYYYAGRVPAGGSTEELIESCTVIGSAPDANYTLSVEILASAIQADGLNDEGQPPVVAEWGVTLDADFKTISKA